MTNISIVTAFFDIGRGGWTQDKGHPHYLLRTNETYIERFSYLAQLENEMVVFTTEDMIPKLKKLREGKQTHFFPSSILSFLLFFFFGFINRFIDLFRFFGYFLFRFS